MESEWLRNSAEVDFIGVFYRILQAPFRDERISVRFGSSDEKARFSWPIRVGPDMLFKAEIVTWQWSSGLLEVWQEAVMTGAALHGATPHHSFCFAFGESLPLREYGSCSGLETTMTAGRAAV